MKKIIFLNDSLVLAGTENLLVNLLNHLHATQKADVTLLLPYPSPDNIMLDKLNSGVEVRYIHKQQPLNGFLKKINEIWMIFFPLLFLRSKGIDTAGFDCYVAFKEGFYANLFAKVKRPNILWIHNIMYKRVYTVSSFKERLAIILNKKELAQTYKHYLQFSKIIGVSNACVESFKTVLGCKEEISSISILPNGLDIKMVKKRAEEFNPKYDKNFKNFILLTRDSPDKCPERILEIAKILFNRDVSNVKFHVIGLTGSENFVKDCPYFIEIKDMIQFHGVQQNPYPFIKNADWSLCISNRESFSLSVLESIILETPVLSTACGGPQDILDNGRLGMIVPCDSFYLAEVIFTIATNDLNLAYKTAMKSIEYDYSTQYWYEQIEKLLDL